MRFRYWKKRPNYIINIQEPSLNNGYAYKQRQNNNIIINELNLRHTRKVVTIESSFKDTEHHTNYYNLNHTAGYLYNVF